MMNHHPAKNCNKIINNQIMLLSMFLPQIMIYVIYHERLKIDARTSADSDSGITHQNTRYN
jgi:hypothetical protein